MNAPRFCGQCGSGLAAGTRFCSSCGTEVAGQAPVNPAATVDSARAADIVPARASRRSRPTWLIVTVVVVVGISGAVAAGTGALAGLSGEETLAAVGMRLPAPEGWEEVQSAYGQVLAQRQDDLAAGAPQGPRIQVRPGELYGTTALWGAGGFPDAGTTVSIREGPTAITVGSPGREGIEIVVQEQPADGGGASFITRYVTVALDGGRAVLITMEAPAGSFDQYRSAFDAALRNASFAL